MVLIVQGIDVETAVLKEIAKAAGASGIESIRPQAFRMLDAKPGSGLAELCDAHQLDHAFVPEERRFGDQRLLVMDMDSTLITIETIDELADLVGRKAEVAAVTAQAM